MSIFFAFGLVTRLHAYERLCLGGMSCIHAIVFAFRDAHQLERDSAVCASMGCYHHVFQVLDKVRKRSHFMLLCAVKCYIARQIYCMKIVYEAYDVFLLCLVWLGHR